MKADFLLCSRICVPPTAVLKLHLCLSGLGVDLSQTACNNLLGHKFFYPTVQWLKDNKIPYKVVGYLNRVV